MFNPTREQVRQFFIDAWRKHRARDLLMPMEDIAVRIVLIHPEYHTLLEDPETALAREWTPESSELNPFLHLSLHLAVEEQLSIDQPVGLRAAFEAMLAGRDRHDALHVVLECLGETVWKAQRDGREVDGTAYLECIRRKS